MLAVQGLADDRLVSDVEMNQVSGILGDVLVEHLSGCGRCPQYSLRCHWISL